MFTLCVNKRGDFCRRLVEIDVLLYELIAWASFWTNDWSVMMLIWLHCNAKEKFWKYFMGTANSHLGHRALRLRFTQYPQLRSHRPHPLGDTECSVSLKGQTVDQDIGNIGMNGLSMVFSWSMVTCCPLWRIYVSDHNLEQYNQFMSLD